ncbi:hypothetical protein LguiB_027011 [Lonicera macranthoides]
MVLALMMLENSFNLGFVPDVVTLTKVVEILCKEGRAMEAIEVLARVESKGGKMEDGFKILELMVESKSGFGGRVSPYNSLLYGLYKDNRWDEALEYLTKMGNLFPKAVDRSLRIIGLCKEGSIEEAKRVYDQMKVEGVVPCALVYVSLINGYSQEGCVREAFELMNEMVVQGYFPVASMFNPLIDPFCGQGKVVGASKLLEDMVGRGCLPNLGSYSPLVDAFCAKGDFHRAFMFFLQMVEKESKKHYWNVTIANIVVDSSLEMRSQSLMLAINNGLGIEETKEMRKEGLVVSASTNLVVIATTTGYYLRDTLFQNAFACRLSITSSNLQVHVRTGPALGIGGPGQAAA